MSIIDHLISATLSQKRALWLARKLLRSAGIGSGGEIGNSGEIEAAAKTFSLFGEDRQPLVLFDVGGNVGKWTLAAKRRWPTAALHVFEPSHKHLEILYPALAGLNSVAVNPMALGKAPGTATLYKDNEITGLASLTKRDISHVGLSMEITEIVAVNTIDIYCNDNGIDYIDFLKIDVEGHELDVLMGAAKMLSNRLVKFIQFEFGGCNIDTKTYFKDFYNFFIEKGYSIYLVNANGNSFKIPFYSEYLEQFMTTNYIAIRN